MKGNLKFVVLQLLTKENLSGYALAKRISELTGWKPSYGSIYPFLCDAQKKGLLRVRSAGRKKVYSITALGRKELEKHNSTRDDFVDDLIKQLKSFPLCYGASLTKKEVEYFAEIFQNLKKGDIPLGGIMKEALELKLLLFRFNCEGRIEPNRQKIKKILSKALVELRGLE